MNDQDGERLILPADGMDLAILLVAGLTHSTHCSAFFPYKELFTKTSNLVSVYVSCVSSLKTDEIYGRGYKRETTMMLCTYGCSVSLQCSHPDRAIFKFNL
jgi:hypothetical protein